jgi:hypothetical protein
MDNHMRVFHCDYCDHLVFFENVQCVRCGKQLAWLQDKRCIGALEPADGGVFRRLDGDSETQFYKLCGNYSQYQVCNWAIPADSAATLCMSCALNRVIPDLSQPGAAEAWYRIETAKRRLVYTLKDLGAPLRSKMEDPEAGLAFDFLAEVPGAPPVLTGHSNGVITINVAESDDAEREKRRQALHEPYRTLLGHFRHESGHYYWDRLVRNSDCLASFRELFGDEREDYAEALERHYQQGAPPDWSQRFISAYASSHAWEDWAETWAHYLHMRDTLDTAAACGLSLRPVKRNRPSMVARPLTESTPFERIIDDWFSITYVLNNLNRGLGLADAYPFVLSTMAIEKLRFIHDTVSKESEAAQ